MSDCKDNGLTSSADGLLCDFMYESPEVSCEKLPTKQRFLRFLKHRQTWGFLVSVAIMAVISLAFFYPANVEGLDLRQHDMLQGIANGQEITTYHEATGETSRWTNSLFGGMPTFQISPSYPSDSLFRWITTVYGLGLPSPSNLLFMMMVGFMILMMAMKIRWEYGLIGAIAWGFSTYFIIIIGAGHIWKFVTLAYIPPTIAGIMLVYRRRYMLGGALTALFAMMQLCSNHIQMSYYFGFVILGIMIAYLVSAIKGKDTKKWMKSTGVLAVAALLAVVANLPNLYHTYKYAKESQREVSELKVGEEVDGSGLSTKEYITQYSYGRSELFTLFIPNIKGGASARPVKGNMEAMPLSKLDGAKDFRKDKHVSTYLSYTSQYFGEPEGTNGPIYVGVIIFALFLMGCFTVKGPLKWALVVLTLLSVLLALGRNFMPLTDLFIDLVPMYSKFRTPESILVIAEFTIPLLAVLGLVKFLDGAKHIRAKEFKFAVGSFGVTGFFCLLAMIMPSIYGKAYNQDSENYISAQLGKQLEAYGASQQDIDSLSIRNPQVQVALEELRYGMARKDATRSLLFLIAGFLPLAAVRYGKMKSLASGAIVGVLVLGDLYSVNKRYLAEDSFSRIKHAKATKIQPTEIDQEILLDTDENYRVLDIDRFWIADPSYFHKMLGGYHAAKLGRYQDMIDNGLIYSDNVYNMLNARYIVYNGQAWYNDQALGNAWFVDGIDYFDGARNEIGALADLETSRYAVADSRFKDTLGKAAPGAESDFISETSYAPNRLTYRSSASSDRVAVFSEVYFPWGWEATIDGKPAEIGRVNYILRAMRIPAGEHEIVMTFDPKSVKNTVALAYTSVSLIYIWLILSILFSFTGCPFKKLRHKS